MNETIVHQAVQAVKQIARPTDIPTIDEENDRLYSDDHFRYFRVPVTLTRRGFISVFAQDAKAAEAVTRVIAAFADNIDDAVQTEQVGKAIAS